MAIRGEAEIVECRQNRRRAISIAAARLGIGEARSALPVTQEKSIVTSGRWVIRNGGLYRPAQVGLPPGLTAHHLGRRCEMHRTRLAALAAATALCAVPAFAQQNERCDIEVPSRN